jgi:hypothetical protein
MRWTTIDGEFWRAKDGSLVRQVKYQGNEQFVGWRLLRPVLYYFHSLGQAQRAVEKQAPHRDEDRPQGGQDGQTHTAGTGAEVLR